MAASDPHRVPLCPAAHYQMAVWQGGVGDFQVCHRRLPAGLTPELQTLAELHGLSWSRLLTHSSVFSEDYVRSTRSDRFPLWVRSCSRGKFSSASGLAAIVLQNSFLTWGRAWLWSFGGFFGAGCRRVPFCWWVLARDCPLWRGGGALAWPAPPV